MRNGMQRQPYRAQKQIQDEIFGVFVGDIPTEVNEKDLKELFSKLGEVVKCKVIRDPQTGISKKYGFVHFPTEELRSRAINEMHNTIFKGQTITVRSQHYKETDRCLVKPGTRSTDLYIGNIPKDLTKHQLQDEVAKWNIPRVHEIRTFRNESGAYCFLCFYTDMDVMTALDILKDDMNPRFLAGRALLIQGTPGAASYSNSASIMNHLTLQTPGMSTTVQNQQIQQSIEMTKALLGGEMCPLTDQQVILLEKKSEDSIYSKYTFQYNGTIASR
eukprot:UN26909